MRFMYFVMIERNYMLRNYMEMRIKFIKDIKVYSNMCVCVMSIKHTSLYNTTLHYGLKGQFD